MNALPVMLAWLAAILLSLVALVLGAVRHGGRGVAVALLCPLGAALMFGLVSAAAGLGEGVWRWGSRGLWVALAIGISGVALQVVGWRAVLRRRARPGECKWCRYPLAGLASCPECGRAAPKPDGGGSTTGV